MKTYNTQDFLLANMMGPNSITMLKELIKDIKITPDMRILDLGCGKGLTSIYLADEFKADIFAQDLWVSATENYERFQGLGLDNITPINADATHKTFADNFFDMLVSIDGYHYFGDKEGFLDENIAPLVKKGGIIALGFPGVKEGVIENIPEEMLVSWSKEDIQTFSPISRWKKLMTESKTVELISINEMECFDEAWNDWLKCDNSYAQNDAKGMATGAGKYMNLISIVCRKK